MRKVGDYEWRQVSMWNFSPDKCIDKHVVSDCGKHVFHFYLTQIDVVIDDDTYHTKVVDSLEGVPDEVLHWRGDDYRLKDIKKS